jgi:POT family proton-dependent oligopeptide transporter
MTMNLTHPSAPDPNRKGWPPGIPYIIGNEGCERFSFYGMRAILLVYLVAVYQHLELTGMGHQARAAYAVHTFGAAAYALPMIGAIIADRLLGKYRTIIWLSLVYCLGHAVLAIFEGSLWGIYTGLGLIAVGAGGIKPCVSAHVGDQFGKSNWHLIEKVYQAFYFIINFGSFFATLFIPYLYHKYGPRVAFGLPGVLMLMATIAFWMGRKKFVHVPPKPGGWLGLLDTLSGTVLFVGCISWLIWTPESWSMGTTVGAYFGFFVLGLVLFQVRQQTEQDDGFLAVLFYCAKVSLFGEKTAPKVGKETGGRLHHHWFFGPAARRFGEEAAEGPIAVLKIIAVFAMVTFFWALFDQHASTWTFQAQQFDRTFILPFFGAWTLHPEQISAANPAIIVLLVPIMTFAVFPALKRVGIRITPLRRMTTGMFLASLAFVAVALLQARLDAGVRLHITWQLLAYVIITLAEVLVSSTGLEFAYSQAPRRMKSTVMGFWLLTVALGNGIVARVATVEGLAPVNFFWLFAGLMAGAAVIFGVIAAFYRYQEHPQ